MALRNKLPKKRGRVKAEGSPDLCAKAASGRWHGAAKRSTLSFGRAVYSYKSSREGLVLHRVRTWVYILLVMCWESAASYWQRRLCISLSRSPPLRRTRSLVSISPRAWASHAALKLHSAHGLSFSIKLIWPIVVRNRGDLA